MKIMRLSHRYSYCPLLTIDQTIDNTLHTVLSLMGKKNIYTFLLLSWLAGGGERQVHLVNMCTVARIY